MGEHVLQQCFSAGDRAGSRWAKAPGRSGTRDLATAVYSELARVSGAVGQMRTWQPFVVVDLDGRVLACNRPLLELLCRGEAELLGGQWGAVMPEWRRIVEEWNRDRGVGRMHPRRFSTCCHVTGCGTGLSTIVEVVTTVHAVSHRRDEVLAYTFLLSQL